MVFIPPFLVRKLQVSASAHEALFSQDRSHLDPKANPTCLSLPPSLLYFFVSFFNVSFAFLHVCAKCDVSFSRPLISPCEKLFAFIYVFQNCVYPCYCLCVPFPSLICIVVQSVTCSFYTIFSLCIILVPLLHAKHYVISTAFPGNITVVAGDGRQVPPVVPGGGQSETCAASIMSSSYYRGNVRVRYPTETMRNAEDLPFSSMVSSVGDGLARAGSDGLIDIPGVRRETDLQSSLDLAFPPTTLADPLSCSRHCVVNFACTLTTFTS